MAKLPVILGAFVLILSTMVDAQGTRADSKTSLIKPEEIIVTATKRAQSLQDVPIAVSVVNAAVLEQSQVNDLIDLQTLVPTLRVTQLQNSSQTNFLIRGFGNGANNVGIEAEVGVFIDGVYQSRAASSILDLPELERIEVLRGPQSSIYGKNVSVGAISITTKAPEFEFGGMAELTYGNYDQMIGKASITGPISDKAAFRLSGSINQRDGYYTNTITNGDINDRDRFSLRGQFLLEPSDNFTIKVIADYNKIDETCCGAVQLFNGILTQVIGAPFPFGLGKTIGNPANLFDREVSYNKDPSNELEGKGLSITGEVDLGFANFTSITAYREQTNNSDNTVDFSGADIVDLLQYQKFETFTQEFRLTSKDDGDQLDWLLGAYYFDESVPTCCRTLTFGADTFNFANVLAGGQLPGLQALLGIPQGTFFANGTGIVDNYTLDDKSVQVFANADFHASDKLTFSLGGAYIDSKKSAKSSVVLNDVFSSLNFPAIGEGLVRQTVIAQQYAALGVDATNPAAIAAIEAIAPGTFAAISNGAGAFAAANRNNPAVNPFLAFLPLQFFPVPVNYPNANETGVLKGNKITYQARLAYDFTDKVKGYVSYATGWKGGAINLSSDSRPPTAGSSGRFAQPSDVNVIELGLKSSFDRGYLNLAIFKQEVKDFQSNLFTGAGFEISNAGSEVHKGFEIDAAFAPTEDLVIASSVIVMDPKYKDFQGAPCQAFDLARCGAGQSSRDLSGDKAGGIHEVSWSTSVTYSHEFNSGLSGFLRGEYLYESNVDVVDNVPAFAAGTPLAQRKVNNLNASAGLGMDNGIELVLWGRNLTNDDNLLSAFPTTIQEGSFSGYLNAPRTYGLTVRSRF
jgi:iron complex outermembrane receptor protein